MYNHKSNNKNNKKKNFIINKYNNINFKNN